MNTPKTVKVPWSSMLAEATSLACLSDGLLYMNTGGYANQTGKSNKRALIQNLKKSLHEAKYLYGTYLRT